MSTVVGIVAEGPIDQALLAPLVRSIAKDRAGVAWPVQPTDAFERLHLRMCGHGGVYQAIKRLVKVLETDPNFPYAFVVILLDARTAPIQRKVRKLIAGKHRFVLGIAQHEIEAWWLGDRASTLAWLGFETAPADTAYGTAGYLAEKDKTPKRTLDQLTDKSARLDRRYGEGNLDLAREFAEQWEGKVRLKEISSQCPKRFPPFCQDTAQAFRQVKSAARRPRQSEFTELNLN